MKYLNLFIFSGILLASSSCKKDVLFKPDPTRLTVANFFQDETQMRQAVTGVYGQLQTITNADWSFKELPSDNTTLQMESEIVFYRFREETNEFWTWLPTNTIFSSLFANHYSMLYDINLILPKMEGTDINPTAINTMKGELLFIRAYSYFNLVQFFGAVPLLTTPIVDYTETFNYIRDSEEDIWAQVIADLNAAAELLPPSYPAAEKGRITKGAALSLLGKSYLTLKRYGEAVTTLQQVLTLGYSLLPSYADVFDPANKNHAESIFEIQYLGGNTQGEHSNFAYVFAPRMSQGFVTGHPGANSGWNHPTNDMIAAYEPDDARKDVSLSEGYVDGTGTYIDHPHVVKYTHPHEAVGLTHNNWPVIRYADVLLMLAEAINEDGGPTTNAYGYLNEVRERAGLLPLSGLDQGDFREAVLHERRVELAFENHRWFDLKRTMTPAEMTAHLNAHGAAEKANPSVPTTDRTFNTFDYVFEPHEVLFPIPTDILFNSHQMSQNPGYQ